MKIAQRIKRAALVAGSVLGLQVFAPEASAWDDEGHRVVALIAEHYLRPAAREQVSKILETDTDALTNHDFASAATWADRYLESDRGGSREHYFSTVQWHYADIAAVRPDIPKACSGRPSADGILASQGPANACVIEKIEQFAAELSNGATPPGERLLALKFLLNLVADAHQPMRVAEEHDDHGRRTLVSADTIAADSLFAYWDSALTRQLDADGVVLSERLLAKIREADARLWSSGTPQLWVLEAHQIGVTSAYGMLGRVDENGRFPLSTRDLAAASDIVAIQLSRAGVRLAYVLNQALAPFPATLRIQAPRGNVQAGHTFAVNTCRGCHAVEPGRNPANEQTRAPDFAAIANTPGISEDALREFLFGPHPTMPTIALTGDQANDAIAFILSMKK